MQHVLSLLKFFTLQARIVLSGCWRAMMPKPAAYQPERYYMRGPGPKWREKNSAAGPQ